MSRHDAEWITHCLDSITDAWMQRYVAGDAYGAAPIWELVVDGRALVYGTALREAAYKTVEGTWPRSLALLELARLAVELGSDLGLITAMVIARNSCPGVCYAMNFADAEDRCFLERLRDFKGERNTAVFGPNFELVRPDLRPREFTL